MAGAGEAARGLARASADRNGDGRASSDLVRQLAGARRALPRREAILLLALVNHPDLLGERVEMIAEMDFANNDLELMRGALLDIAIEPDLNAETARGALTRRGFADLIERLDQLWAGAGRAEWWVAAETAIIDVERGWDHTAALHHKLVTLHRELKAAEIALQAEPSDENLARLFDIQTQLMNAEGTEALMEGFGQASGRPARAF